METTKTKNPSMSVPLFVPLSAPVIDSTSHAPLVKWRRARKEYEQQVAMRLNHDEEKIAETVTSVKDSFAQGLLEVLCDLEWGINMNSVTDDVLLEKIDGIISTVVNNTLPNVATEFKLAVKMDMFANGWSNFFKDGRQLIEERGWNEFFTDQEGKKLKCKMLVGAIGPPALRNEVEAILAHQNRSARTDERALFHLILDRAFEHERDFQRRKGQRKAVRPDSADIEVSNNRPKKKAKFGGNGMLLKSSYGGTDKAEKTNFPIKREVIKLPSGGCLKCQGAHWLVHCPTASADEKKTLLRKQHGRRNQERKGR